MVQLPHNNGWWCGSARKSVDLRLIDSVKPSGLCRILAAKDTENDGIRGSWLRPLLAALGESLDPTYRPEGVTDPSTSWCFSDLLLGHQGADSELGKQPQALRALAFLCKVVAWGRGDVLKCRLWLLHRRHRNFEVI